MDKNTVQFDINSHHDSEDEAREESNSTTGANTSDEESETSEFSESSDIDAENEADELSQLFASEENETSEANECSDPEEDETSKSDESTRSSDELPIEILKKNTPTGYVAQVRHEIVDYLNIVALPGIPANSLWRLLNLWGIPRSISIDNALLPYVAKETIATSITVGPVIFITASLVDALRTMYQYDQTSDLNLVHEFDTPYCQAWLNYWSSALNKYRADKSYIDSLLLGFKFLMAALGWTIGDSFFYESPLLFQTLGAGAGNALGLFVACLLANLLQYYRGKNINEGEHWFVSTLKVSVAGFFEGIAWSAISSINIYREIMRHVSYNTYEINMIKASASFFDSLSVGIGSSIAFSLSPIFSVSIEHCLRYLLSCSTTQTSLPPSPIIINEEITIKNSSPSHRRLGFFNHVNEEQQEHISETTQLLPRDNSMHNLFSMTNNDFENPQDASSDDDSYFYDESEEDESAWCRGDITCSML